MTRPATQAEHADHNRDNRKHDPRPSDVRDKNYINEYPDDAAVIAKLVREANFEMAVEFLQVWGSKQRDIGAIKSLEILKGSLR